MELPSIDSASTALVAGLVTSLHCLGMCGPLACAVVPLRGDRADAQVASSIYHLARLTSYAVFGALFGALGRLPMDWMGSGIARYLPWLLVAFFMAMAFRLDQYLPRVPGLGSVYLRVHGWGRARPPAVAAAVLGLATPLLPCGPLYFVMALAMVTGSAWRGAEFMLAFGLGTVPLLWLLQVNFHWIKPKLPASWLNGLRMGLAIVAALVIAWRLRGTLGFPGPSFDHFVCH